MIPNNQILMNQLRASNPIQPLQSPTPSLSNEKSESDFLNLMNSSIASLEQAHLKSDQAIEGLVTGEANNLHEVMIQTSEAQISLELAVQMRNRCLEAMNEIKNMQF